MLSYWGVDHGSEEVHKAVLPNKFNRMMQGVAKPKRGAAPSASVGAPRRTASGGMKRGPGYTPGPMRSPGIRPVPAMPTRNGGRNIDWDR